MRFLKNKKYTEDELLQGCRENDRAFQELLYKEFFDTMMRMCRRYTSNHEEAIDIVNNGFIKVFKKIETYESRGSLEGWIRRCVYNCLSDYFRKKNKEVRFLEMEDYRNPRINNGGLASLYLEDLMNMVDYLPATTKKAFILFNIEGFSHKEIGIKLEMSEGTSKWHVSNARKKLREMIQKNQISQRRIN